VACTRAQSQLTLWWANSKKNTAASPLQRVLYSPRGQAPVVPALAYPPPLPSPSELPWLAAGGIEVSVAAERQASAAASHRKPAPLPAPPAFTREIDDWRRTSYSGITADAHDSPFLPDEPETPAPAQPDTPPDSDAPLSPLAGFPGGTAFGSLVHEIFEQLDWFAPAAAALPALEARLLQSAESALQRYPLPVAAPDLAAGLLPSLLTPLGGLTGGRPLAAIPTSERLAELDFEYPMPAQASVRDIAALWRETVPADDLLSGYAAALANPALAGQRLFGALNGSIDVVLRVAGRYLVIDYKTNSLGPVAELRPQLYHPQAMAAEMISCHYPLQAALYCVALHRFLGRRLPDYRPEAHLGGVGYLFVRGMDGADPTMAGGWPTGVFGWYPPTALVLGLSELLGGGK
jgi:exodeoxyribonuclease V beta subunit